MTTTETQIDHHLTALRLIQTDRAAYEKAVHDAARRTLDENPLIVAQSLGEYLGYAVNVDTLCDLAAHLQTVETDGYSGFNEGEFHRRRVESLTSSLLAGPVSL